MQEILKSFIVRPAEMLTQKQADTIAIKSHPNLLQSKRYVAWLELCKQEKFQELEIQMKNFLNSPEVINSYQKIPAILKNHLEFADYNGYKFNLNDFIKVAETDVLKTDDKNSGRNEERFPDFKTLYTNLADQLLAESIVNNTKESNANFDKQAILKTLHLIEIIISQKRDKIEFNVGRVYEKPILLPTEFYEIDWCRFRKLIPVVVNNKVPEPQAQSKDNKEPDCDCGKTPEKGPCECTCDETCVEQNPCCAKIVPYVADLYVVKEVVRGYEVSEMSYIENVMKDEIRERVHRDFEREEIETQHEEEQTSFEQHEHQVDEKFSLQKEVEKQIDQTISIDAGVTAHQKWGTGDVTATTNFGFNQTKKDAQKSIQNNAKDVIDKSISSLQKKVRDLSIKKVIKEIEITNKHVFGGTSGATINMSQQFYYVNQVKKGQVFNWGKRQLIDLYLPEPSELYKRLVEKRFNRKKPEKPCITISEISPEKYTYYAKCLGLKDVQDLPPPPKITTYQYVNLKKNEKQEDSMEHGWWGDWKSLGSGSDNGPMSFDILDGYQAINMESSLDGTNIKLSLHNKTGYIEFNCNGSTLIYGYGVSTVGSNSLPMLEGTQFVSVDYLNVIDYSVSIRIKLQLKPELLLKWQLPIYYKIMEAYEKELADYNTALAEFEKSKESVYRQNPFILLQEIQEQLKQAAISYISCQFFDSMDAMKHNVMPCGFPQFDIRESKKEGDFVRFFEQAFEWKFMNFIFYPYFWSRKCTWEKKMKEDADNMLFQRFLKAGFARVSIPVRPGFEGHVNWYLKTRQIWSRAEAPSVPGVDFLPIIQEIKEDKENFNTEREGLLLVTPNSSTVTLINSDYYWNIGNPTSTPVILPHLDQDKINNDLYRELFIDCVQYKIMSIVEDTTVAFHKRWTIVLDRNYEGISSLVGLPWSTGAVFVGAPWEFRVPTKLVWMRTSGNDLPKKYPVE